MQLTKFGHACVRVEIDGRRLVIDPGGLTDPQALAGAEAVLVTHEHFDHFSEEALRKAAEQNPALRIWTNTSVARKLDGLGARVTAVGAGEIFTAAGFEVKVYGTWHAVIHPDLPRVGNIGFLIEDALFHPGDALTVPDTTVDTLLLPVHGPWSTTGQLIDYVREVAPRQALAVHDGALNDVGTAMVAGLLGGNGPGTPYRWIPAGASAEIACNTTTVGLTPAPPTELLPTERS
ncbi:MBL fold metallo-hydrolase [Nocardia colli]|uniref:MBL fold metallo-hydrolase n=1 Tax=Nocardia colli TaxID=2545717 RepID=UPI0035E2ECE0